ncbi:serine hydrolase [Trebonia kvetii]|uniref:Serine hydrolase n=1 Tax=Trebonia kvetii TaxID=2480626 RepID=A0A6P2C2Q0_9ACTN|nr:serine hydrolase [Trebonia kvetii]TVZ05644.1 serine hydrolase [Trebonia kvetii]
MESIDRFIADQLAAWEVPGCAVAAVRNGQVELVSGWGLRDREAALPVTKDTLFAIGSTTKAFTATTIGALVDEGLLDWDRPLRDYVPEIRLHDPVVSDRLTIVDLLSHRSGLPRHDLTWVGQPDRSRAEIVRALRFLPLSKDLRQQFQYCNLGYVAAGYVVEALTGVPWEDFVRGRLLEPLGMRRTNLSVDEMLADDDHATAYTRQEGVMVRVPQRPLPAIAPAGAINSSAADMARWLLAQLGGGQLDGATVMSPATAKRQLTPHMLIPGFGEVPGLSAYAYGLGWLNGRYREHTLAMHDGGIDGFTTHCMLLPDDGVGVVVLTNTSAAMMHWTVACRVLDELLGAEPVDVFGYLKPRFDAAMAGAREAKAARRVVAGAPPAHPLSDYAGEYEHPGYGILTITPNGGVLKPSLGTMDLSLAHRHYDTFDLAWSEAGDQPAIYPLTFLSGPDGYVNALTVPFEALVEPLRFDKRPDEQGPEVLARLCGAYAMGPIEVVVGLRSERTLTITAPGSPPLDLEPIGGLRFGVKDQPAITAEFELDDSGGVTRLVAQPLGIFLPRDAS